MGRFGRAFPRPPKTRKLENSKTLARKLENPKTPPNAQTHPASTRKGFAAVGERVGGSWDGLEELSRDRQKLENSKTPKLSPENSKTRKLPQTLRLTPRPLERVSRLWGRGLEVVGTVWESFPETAKNSKTRKLQNSRPKTRKPENSPKRSDSPRVHSKGFRGCGGEGWR